MLRPGHGKFRQASGQGRRRISSRRSGSGWSATYDGLNIEAIAKGMVDDALRTSVIEAATEASADEGFDGDWEIEVELNMDDGRTIHAVVTKAADGKPQITE